MKKILLATVAILAFAAPSFAAEPAKTVGQAPPSFYLVQDSATMARYNAHEERIRMNLRAHGW